MDELEHKNSKLLTGGVYGDLLDFTTACFGENGFNLKLACGLKEKIIDSNLQFIWLHPEHKSPEKAGLHIRETTALSETWASLCLAICILDVSYRVEIFLWIRSEDPIRLFLCNSRNSSMFTESFAYHSQIIFLSVPLGLLLYKVP